MEKVFIFDMDGVIIDSEPIHQRVEREAAAQYGVRLDDERMQFYTGTRSEDLWKTIIEEENLDVNLGTLLSEVEGKKAIEIENSHLQPIEGIASLLEHLKNSQYKIALASSSSRALIQTVLTKYSIQHYYDFIVSGEEVEEGKPAPDIYLEVSRQLNVDPSDCVVLEDSANGVSSANAAGMRTIGFQSDDEQQLTHAHHIVARIDEVFSLL
ncbi:HAD family hydrolase [Natribacillus halophilus]|uniref:Haloacid dehalogenase superfamily, subfamily IA, variant 3 with third motif having DD or ED n=1 Tax=Natribacillus halophilus TaxID=549003 RepID=A0A1G8S882_9BACI|nr:HAD family phosphatase [Natribacillus halophilus]SDJ24975.1 haloacid dehalogenase superfamily, subfamily IA, variant 3 with third motif having DD or ED [Natribacillus halophilus]